MQVLSHLFQHIVLKSDRRTTVDKIIGSMVKKEGVNGIVATFVNRNSIIVNTISMPILMEECSEKYGTKETKYDITDSTFFQKGKL